MTGTNDPALRARILELLVQVAPDVDAPSVAPEIDFREQFDFDSMDTLNFAIALARAFGVEVPERDYRELRSLASCEAYLARVLAAGGPRSEGA
jgi:acyl carrier protein